MPPFPDIRSRAVRCIGALAAAGILLPAAERHAHAAPAVISGVVVRDLAGSTVDVIVPGDTVFADATLSDADGFRDITRIDLTLQSQSALAGPAGPAYRAAYSWTQEPSGDARTRAYLARAQEHLARAREIQAR